MWFYSYIGHCYYTCCLMYIFDHSFKGHLHVGILHRVYFAFIITFVVVIINTIMILPCGRITALVTGITSTFMVWIYMPFKVVFSLCLITTLATEIISTFMLFKDLISCRLVSTVVTINQIIWSFYDHFLSEHLSSEKIVGRAEK